jgi:hypothetical protein
MMTKFKVCVLVLVMVALAAPSALGQQRQRGQRGQRGGGGFGGAGSDVVSLLSQKSVQEELKLSEDQVKKVTELAGAGRGAGRGNQNLSAEERQKMQQERAKTNEKALADILKPEQLKRAKQIAWQQQAAQAFSNPEVATAISLTDEQKEKIRTIQADARQQGGQARRGGGGNPQDAQNRREALRKETNEKVMSLLTAEQKAKWKELTGETFKGEITRTAGRRSGRGATPPSQS